VEPSTRAEPALPGSAPVHPATGAPFAGFWQRFISFCIDGAILSAVCFLLLAPVIADWLIPEDAKGTALGDIVLGPILAVTLILASTLVSLSYFSVGDGLGGTAGKRMLGLRVVNSNGSTPGLPTGFLRNLMRLVTSVAWFVGLFAHLWMIWDERNQTLYDKMAGTYVVRQHATGAFGTAKTA